MTTITERNTMANEIPELDDLLKGVNGPDTGTKLSDADITATQTAGQSSTDGCWERFLACIESPNPQDREGRLACKIDRDLADTLDDCDIHGRCRSDLVNAIVRAFFGAYLPRLADYRMEKKSLFDGFREGQPQKSNKNERQCNTDR